jgi:hypothetical protein
LDLASDVEQAPHAARTPASATVRKARGWSVITGLSLDENFFALLFLDLRGEKLSLQRLANFEIE